MIYLLLTKVRWAYNTIDNLNLGKRGGGELNSPGLSRCGDIDIVMIRYIEEP